MINDKAGSLTIEIAGDLYEIRQSPGLLTSTNTEGTTGAALWKISPCIADWLADRNNILWKYGLMHKGITIVELGCGITGLIGLVLSKLVSTYVLTDQRSVLKRLQENVGANTPAMSQAKGKSTKRCGTNFVSNRVLHAIELNWETDEPAVLDDVLQPDRAVDMVIVCDCVFNDFLLRPLVTTLGGLCSRHADRGTFVLIAQQLRSDEVFTAFLEMLITKFDVWRITDSHLPDTLRSTTGFAIHLAKLR